jgi:hypothetical protein
MVLLEIRRGVLQRLDQGINVKIGPEDVEGIAIR